MPVTWKFEGPVLVVATSGHYANEELERAVADASADPAFVPGAAILFDSRQSTANLSRSDIEWRLQWVYSLRRRGFASQAAILVASEPHRFGLARMLQIQVSEQDFRLEIFRSYDEAMGWLTNTVRARGPSA